MKRFLMSLFPNRWTAPTGLQLNEFGKHRFLRVMVGVLGVAIGVVAIALLSPDNWRDVVAGALLAFSVSTIAWSLQSHQESVDQVRDQLQRDAERLLLHIRLNDLAEKLGVRRLDLEAGLGNAIEFQMVRLAHLYGLEEFYPPVEPSKDWWDGG
jgi:hypothetical protein